MRDRQGWAMRIREERAIHVGLAATSCGHRGSPDTQFPVDVTAFNSSASTITLRTRWATVAYALRRIIRLFSFHEVKMTVEANPTRSTCDMLAIAKTAWAPLLSGGQAPSWERHNIMKTNANIIKKQDPIEYKVNKLRENN